MANRSEHRLALAGLLLAVLVTVLAWPSEDPEGERSSPQDTATASPGSGDKPVPQEDGDGRLSVRHHDTAPERSGRYRVRGTVVGPQGFDTQGVTVDVRAVPVTESRGAAGRVDARGQFVIECDRASLSGDIEVSGRNEAAGLVSHPVRLNSPAEGQADPAVLLQMVPAASVRIRVVDQHMVPIAGAQVLVTEVSQTSYRSDFGSWEAGAYAIRDRIHASGRDGRLSCVVREGDVRVRVRLDSRSAWGTEIKRHALQGQIAEFGDQVAPGTGRKISIRVRGADGPIPASVRLDKRAIRIGHPLQGNDIHHFRVGRGEVLEFLVCDEDIPIVGAATSPGYHASAFEIGSIEFTEVSVELTRKARRSIRVEHADGSPFVGDIDWRVDIDGVANPARQGSQRHPIAVFDELIPLAEILAGPKPGSFVLVSPGEQDVNVEALIRGGIRISEPVATGFDGDRTHVIRLPRVRRVEIEIAKAPGQFVPTQEYSWDVLVRRAGGGKPVRFVLASRLGNRVEGVWVPMDAERIRFTETSGVFVESSATLVEASESLRCEIALSESASRVELSPTLGGHRIEAEGLWVILSGVDIENRKDSRMIPTGRDGVARAIIPAGQYAARLYPIVGPTSPARFTASSRATTTTELSARQSR